MCWCSRKSWRRRRGGRPARQVFVQKSRTAERARAGPCTAPIARIKGVYRFHLILKAASRKALNTALRGLLAHADEAGVPRSNLIVDVDALRLM